MFDLALTLAVSVLLVLAGGVSLYCLPWKDEEVLAASTGVTGVINLALICFSAMLLAGMLVS